MSKKEIDYCKCPHCSATVEIDIEFAIKNERIFCESCCRAFDIKVKKTNQDSKEEHSDLEKMLLDQYKERQEDKNEEIQMVEEAKTFGNPIDWDEYDGYF